MFVSQSVLADCGPCRDILHRLPWDKTFRLTEKSTVSSLRTGWNCTSLKCWQIYRPIKTPSLYFAAPTLWYPYPFRMCQVPIHHCSKFRNCGVSPDHIITHVTLSLWHVFITHGKLHIPSLYYNIIILTQISEWYFCLYIVTLCNYTSFQRWKPFYYRREMPVGRPLYKMVTLFWKTNVLIICISCICATDGANILGIFPMPSKSHMRVHSALVKELASRGHQVTVFSPFPEKYPIQNFTDIEFKLSYADLLQNSGEYNLQV